MKRKINNKITVAGIFCITAIISILGIFGPGILLHSADNLNENNVENVPDAYYSASKTAMARNNSKRMKVNEKLQLISGDWESTIMPANDYEMTLDNYEAVKMAKEKLSEIYKLNMYPTLLSDEYGNWHSWTTECFKAVDATFKTYTAYYWVINLNKYDDSEKHTIYMLDDGTLFFAKAWHKDGLNVSKMSNAYEIKDIEGEEAKENLETEKVSDWINYPGIAIDDMKWKALSYITKDNEEYLIMQGYTDNEYLYSRISLLTEESQ